MRTVLLFDHWRSFLRSSLYFRRFQNRLCLLLEFLLPCWWTMFHAEVIISFYWSYWGICVNESVLKTLYERLWHANFPNRDDCLMITSFLYCVSIVDPPHWWLIARIVRSIKNACCKEIIYFIWDVNIFPYPSKIILHFFFFPQMLGLWFINQ